MLPCGRCGPDAGGFPNVGKSGPDQAGWCGQKVVEQRPAGRGEPARPALGQVGQDIDLLRRPRRACATALIDQRSALLLALCDDIGPRAAYDGEAVAGAFLRLLDSLTGSPEAGPHNPGLVEEPAMASPSSASIPAMAARWWMAWAWLQGGGRHGHTSGDTPAGAQRLLDDFPPPLPARRHRLGTAASRPATSKP